MSKKNKPQPSETQSQAIHKGVSDELSRQAIKDLAGYLDVLIEMDFAYMKRKEKDKKNVESKK